MRSLLGELAETEGKRIDLSGQLHRLLETMDEDGGARAADKSEVVDVLRPPVATPEADY